MKKKMYLHIGHNKTGTSAIQHALKLNEDLLSGNGICYPKSGRSEPFFAAHHMVASMSSASLGQWLEEVQVEAKGCEKIIVSSEALFDSPKSKQLISEISKVFDAVVVAFVREPFSYLSSWYREGVKSKAFSWSFDDFLWVHRNRQLSTWLSNWNPHVIKSFEVDAVGKGVVEKFFEIVGVEIPYAETLQNPSISGNLLAAKRTLNTLANPHDIATLGEEVTTLRNLSSSFCGPMLLSQAHIDLIQQYFVPDYEAVTTKWGLKPGRFENLGFASPNADTWVADMRLLSEYATKHQFASADALVALSESPGFTSLLR